ncbi:hypothetical protein TYRP_006462 [Tyrophagus putrescentiae]|nr:hypothetical protein TYRP_006462 [Tyrophagus putrescentiae]
MPPKEEAKKEKEKEEKKEEGAKKDEAKKEAKKEEKKEESKKEDAKKEKEAKKEDKKEEAKKEEGKKEEAKKEEKKKEGGKEKTENGKGGGPKKTVYKGKAPGWLKDPKFLYSDNKVQELVKKAPPAAEVPGVAGGPDGLKSQGKRPQHLAKVHFKPSEAVAKEAVKVHELLDKMVVKAKEGGGGGGRYRLNSLWRTASHLTGNALCGDGHLQHFLRLRSDGDHSSVGKIADHAYLTQLSTSACIKTEEQVTGLGLLHRNMLALGVRPLGVSRAANRPAGGLEDGILRQTGAVKANH